VAVAVLVAVMIAVAFVSLVRLVRVVGGLTLLPLQVELVLLGVELENLSLDLALETLAVGSVPRTAVLGVDLMLLKIELVFLSVQLLFLALHVTCVAGRRRRRNDWRGYDGKKDEYADESSEHGDTSKDGLWKRSVCSY